MNARRCSITLVVLFSLFTQWPFPATGLVGNAPFWDQVVIMDMGIRSRFGLVR